MDFIKAEISSGSEACLTSCDSDHEKISVKEEEESVLTYPVQKAVDEVDDAVSHYIQWSTFYIVVHEGIISLACWTAFFFVCVCVCVCVCIYSEYTCI